MNTFFKKDNLHVRISDTRSDMGICAAFEAVRSIEQVLKQKTMCNIIFAAAPSQNEFLAALVQADVDWSRVNALHMDEYIGLPKDAPQGFANFLRNAIFDRVPFASVHCIDSTNQDVEAECARYTDILKKYPPDLVFMGIGENGHIAFNDPPVADFQDTAAVKPVVLDEICRNQQVNDGCFASLELVPKTALTLTVPTLFSASKLICVVPATTKADAVHNTLNGDISEKCPASILRRHPNAVLFLDSDSAAKL